MSADLEVPNEEDVQRLRVYLDGGEEPIAAYSSPAQIRLETSQLKDGEHEIRIEAESDDGIVGVRRIPFEVRNGPAIDVDGLKPGEVVRGDVSMMVHAWGGADEEDWEPARAESPAPPPTWAWVLVILVLAWALYYGVMYWSPFGSYADSPTYKSSSGQVMSTEYPGVG